MIKGLWLITAALVAYWITWTVDQVASEKWVYFCRGMLVTIGVIAILSIFLDSILRKINANSDRD